MAQNSNEARRQAYFQHSSQLTQFDTVQLCKLLDTSEWPGGWGRNQRVEIGPSQFFVKRVPITDIEYTNMFSTQNLYDLPTYYSYGIGSVGFGVFRELAAHVKTTNWVLNSECDAFPLLYHYRILPLYGERAKVDMEKHEGYVTYWGGNENIGRYMLDRANANYELVLFLEHIPHVLHSWLMEHPAQVNRVLDDARTTVDFLRKKDVIHFDAHYYNMLTDGKRVYLTDFGLLLDRDFALTEQEQAFFDVHTHYDYGEFISNLGYLLYDMYTALPEVEQQQLREKYGVSEEDNRFVKMIFILYENIEEIHARDLLQVDGTLLDCLVKYRSIFLLTRGFFAEMHHNKQKDTKFPHAELQRLLKATGFISNIDYR